MEKCAAAGLGVEFVVKWSFESGSGFMEFK
jgi:hypothetical protein